MDRPRQQPFQQIESLTSADTDVPHQQPEQQQVGVHLPEHENTQRQQQEQGQSGTLRQQPPPSQH